MAAQALPPGHYHPDVRASSEKKLGILHYTASLDFGWYGEIRKRYTDFIVHEVRKDGTVVFLDDVALGVERAKPSHATARGGPENSQPVQDAAAPAAAPAASAPAVTPLAPDAAEPEPAAEPPSVPPVDTEALEALVGPSVAKQMQDLYTDLVQGTAIPPQTQITIAVVQDRSKRGHYHQEIRRIFSGRFDTRADGDSGAIVAVPLTGRNKGGRRRAPVVPQRAANPATGTATTAPAARGNRNSSNSSSSNWRLDSERNPAHLARARSKYLHFTLYKENKDTMEAIGYLARLLKTKPSSFGFAGTKDRRAATTQRVSVWRNNNQDLAWINPGSHNVKVGDFSYHAQPLQLGQHGGNDFVIVVKDVELLRDGSGSGSGSGAGAGAGSGSGPGSRCALAQRLRMTEQCVQAALDHIQAHGFLNYFGLQRFGTHTVGTQEVGRMILSGNFEGACKAILHVDAALVARLHDEKTGPGADADTAATAAVPPYLRDELNRARAITQFWVTGDAGAALQLLPRRFSAEASLLQHLGRDAPSRHDYCGALLRVTRGLRNLYIHAYQSYVWNWVASRRWARHGDTVIAGDLVLVDHDDDDLAEDQLGGGSGGGGGGGGEDKFYQQARALSAAEAASGQYSIFDVVLPVPGFDVVYPDNDIGAFYAVFMGRPENGGLDPYGMRRTQKEFSLSGHYRKLLARFTAVPQFYVRPYRDDAEQMHPTDLDDAKAVQQQRQQQQQQLQLQQRDNAEEPTAEGATNSRRRRLSPAEPAPAADCRDNAVWVEAAAGATGSGGGGGSSKRVKMDADGRDGGPNRDDVVAAFDGEAAAAAAAATAAAPAQNNGDGGAVADRMPTVDEVKRLFDGDGGQPAAAAATAAAAAAAAPAAETALPAAVNLFRQRLPADVRDAGTGDGPTTTAVTPAVNRSDAWRCSNRPPDGADAWPEDMAIAVALNFRLRTSNYATMCLREMMSSAVGAGSGIEE